MKIVIPIIALSALIASGVSAWSGSTGGSLQIKMKIDKECKVSDALLDFGTTTVGSFGRVIEGFIKAQCTKGIQYNIALGPGMNPVNSEPPQPFYRRLILPNDPSSGDASKSRYKDFIPYYLYSDASHSTLWGDGSRSGMPALPREADGTVQSIAVYGKIESVGLMRDLPGTYTDTVTVTVQF
ncbi:spore coat U domain-containing protein [Phyllobacterium sp.]|nr:spore coat protein U domain-containing protein [Phyllobacterium sp.]MBQ9349722.1 spore coat protein U domain-containing protein [Phyllobacterium sp.]